MFFRVLFVLFIIHLIFSPFSHSADVCKNIEKGTERSTYCTAAKNADKAIKYNTSAMALWGAVAGVCTSACAASMLGHPWNEWYCMGTNLTVTAADLGLNFAFNKDLSQSMSSLMGVATTGMSTYMSAKNMKARKTSGTPKAKQKDWGSCVAAAAATVQVVMKGVSRGQHKKTKQNALEQAKMLYSQESHSLAYDFGNERENMGPSTPRSPADSNLYNKNSNSGTTSNANCEQARASGQSTPFIQCATAGNSELSKFTSDPKFKDDFEKISGKTMGDYFKSIDENTSPSEALASAMGGLNSNGELTPKLKALEKEVASQMAQDSSDGVRYAGGGGGGGEAPKDEFADFNQLMQQVMGQLNPQEEKEQTPVSESLDFELSKGNPTQIAENRSLSLFTRVGYRYRKSMDKIEWGPWSSAYNKSKNGRSVTGTEP